MFSSSSTFPFTVFSVASIIGEGDVYCEILICPDNVVAPEVAVNGAERMSCELTLRKGMVVWDRNGIAAQDWQSFPYRKGPFFNHP